ncbi:MAG: hypothetical protein JXQ89_06885 [Pelagimonas sp.]
MPFLFLIFALFLPAAVAAGSPYLSNEATIEHADWGEISVGMLFGDGIIVPDPKRIVVMDADGLLLATSEISIALELFETRSGPQPFVGYNRSLGLLYLPEPTTWKRSLLIRPPGKKTGLPFPEELNASYGFSSRKAAFHERLWYEARLIQQQPLLFFIAVIWWSFMFFGFARIILRWKRNDWQILPVTAEGVWRFLVAGLICYAMGYLTFITWIVEPPASLGLALRIPVGILLAFCLARLSLGWNAKPVSN